MDEFYKIALVEWALRQERVFNVRYNPLESLTEPQFI